MRTAPTTIKLKVVGPMRLPQKDEYDTDSDNDVSDIEEEISLDAVSGCG